MNYLYLRRLLYGVYPEQMRRIRNDIEFSFPKVFISITHGCKISNIFSMTIFDPSSNQFLHGFLYRVHPKCFETLAQT